MSKANFWNSVARGAVKGWDTGREWERQDADEEEKKKTRKMKDVLVDMLMGGQGGEQGGEAAPAAAAEPVAAQEAAPIVAEQVTPQQVQTAPVQSAPVESYTLPPVVQGVRQAQAQAAQLREPAPAPVEAAAAPQQRQGMAALQSLMTAPAPQRAAGKGDEPSFMNALGALAVLKGDINTAAALRGKAQQEQWDAEDAAVAARMMNDPQGEEMQSLMGGILSSALPGVRARRDDKTGETSVYVTDEDGTHEVPLKGQTLLNAIRAKQMLDRGQYGLAVQHLSAIDKTLAERAAQTIQTNLQNMKMAQMQQSMGIADAKLALAQQSAGRDAWLDSLRARQMQQSMTQSAGRYGMAQQEFAARMADREQQRQLAQQHPELLAALAESEGYSPQHVAAIKAGAIKYTPQRAAAGGAGGAGDVGGKEAWDPKAVREFFSKRERDALGTEIKTPDIEAEQALMRYAAQRGINDWKKAYRMREMEGIQRADEMASLRQNQQALAIARDPNLTREQKAAAIRKLQGE